MADRFPSIEEFNDGDTEARATNGSGNADDLLANTSDPQSDFLSRERAALGDDADQFASSGGGDDLLGGGDSAQSITSPTAANGAGEDMNAFQSSFPAVEHGNEAVGPGGTITNTANLPSSTSFSTIPADEPAVIKEWRERRELQINSREEAASARKQETIKSAQEAVDEFYENYNNKKEKNIAQTQKDAEEFLKTREDTTSGGTSWERIAKLVDLGRGGAGAGGKEGKEKFRELLSSLRKDEKAPGAKGY